MHNFDNFKRIVVSHNQKRRTTTNATSIHLTPHAD